MKSPTYGFALLGMLAASVAGGADGQGTNLAALLRSATGSSSYVVVGRFIPVPSPKASRVLEVEEALRGLQSETQATLACAIAIPPDSLGSFLFFLSLTNVMAEGQSHLVYCLSSTGTNVLPATTKNLAVVRRELLKRASQSIMTDPHDKRCRAFFTLSDYSAGIARMAVLTVLEEDARPAVRRDVIGGIGIYHAEDHMGQRASRHDTLCVPLLERGCVDPDAEVRREALALLTRMDPTQTLPRLRSMLSHTNEAVRADIRRALEGPVRGP